MYAVYHGPDGLARDRRSASHRPRPLRSPPGCAAGGVEVVHDAFFDTLHGPGARAAPRRSSPPRASAAINLRLVDADTVGIALDETTDAATHVAAVLRRRSASTADVARSTRPPTRSRRRSRRDERRSSRTRCSTQHRSETAMLRYLRRLADHDLALDRTMIPLGSCTMKLNATAEMEPITWPEFADDPPVRAARPGRRATLELIADLERWLAEITGYDAVSLQPNAGSQGEYAGLLAIRAYHARPRRRRTATCA